MIGCTPWAGASFRVVLTDANEMCSLILTESCRALFASGWGPAGSLNSCK